MDCLQFSKKAIFQYPSTSCMATLLQNLACFGPLVFYKGKWAKTVPTCGFQRFRVDCLQNLIFLRSFWPQARTAWLLASFPLVWPSITPVVSWALELLTFWVYFAGLLLGLKSGPGTANGPPRLHCTSRGSVAGTRPAFGTR